MLCGWFVRYGGGFDAFCGLDSRLSGRIFLALGHAGVRHGCEAVSDVSMTGWRFLFVPETAVLRDG